MATATRIYGGLSADQRRSKRRAALLDAALDVLAADGVEAVTVRGVCTRARLNDRYFYESFADRDELLAALADELAGQGVAAVLAAIDGLPPDPAAQVRAAGEAAIGFILDDQRRGRFLVESQATESLRQRRHAAVRMLAVIMVERGRDILGELAPPDDEAELVALTLVTGALEVVSIWLRGELDVSRERLAEVLMGMVTTAVEHPPGRR